MTRMSHLDELDEFEAELELQLKKEYTAVFGLFRYCVLTQDATYLCNTLDLRYVPQPSYPFFHLRMEDVWVWDKNRPTRMIPRAEVYTSSDVTVEELRGEGEEPKLTAESLAEKPRRAPPRRRILATPPAGSRPSRAKLLRCCLAALAARCPGPCRNTVPSGTHREPRRFGAPMSQDAGGELGEHWRVATERDRTGDELGVLLSGLLDLDASTASA